MVERRAKAEQGVKAVTCLEGDAVWKAGDDGLWSWDLLEAALSRSPSLNVGDVRDNCRQFAPPPNRPTFPKGPLAFLVEYRDGFKAAALLLNGHVDDTTFAARLGGREEAGFDAVRSAAAARGRLPAGADGEDRGVPGDRPAVAAAGAHAADRRRPRRGAGIANPRRQASGDAGPGRRLRCRRRNRDF